jgi:rubrerythrin
LPQAKHQIIGSHNEDTLSKLYSNYSRIDPTDHEFWDKISNDETQHGVWLSELSQKIAQGEVHVNESRFKLEALNGIGSYIKECISDSETTNISAIHALSISLDIENSMLERGVFKIYETDDIELQDVLNKLRSSTEVHYLEVKKKWQEKRTQQ